MKTIIIPIFLHRASMICLNKVFVNGANKIIFDFIWKGKRLSRPVARILHGGGGGGGGGVRMSASGTYSLAPQRENVGRGEGGGILPQEIVRK